MGRRKRASTAASSEGAAAKTAQVGGSEQKNALGAVIRHFRRKLRSDTDGHPFSQVDLYDRCRRIEDPPSRERKGVCFGATSKDQQRLIISRFESGTKSPTTGQRRYLERALELPDLILDESFDSLKAFEELLVNFVPRQPESAGRREKKVDVASIRSLAEDYRIFRRRRALLRRIQERLKPKADRHLRIAALVGEPGIGKTQLIAEWWHIHGRAAFSSNVIAVDCARQTGEQIIRSITQHYVGAGYEQIDSALIDALNKCDNPLIVLDNLSSEAPAVIGQATLVSPTDADQMTLSSVRNLLRRLHQHRARVGILLGIQGDPRSREDLALAHGLGADTEINYLPVQALSEDEGAWMLERLGVRSLSDFDRRRVSRSLLGLPIAIEAAARHLVRTDYRGQEEFIVKLDKLGSGHSPFRDFFAELMAAVEAGRYDEEAHPRALLRLIALMPGATSVILLEALLEPRRIRRLRNARISSYRQPRPPFLLETEGKLDIHPFVRGLLRQELHDILKGDLQDPNTNLEEIAWIHRQAAMACLDGLSRSDSTQFEVAEIELIEGAVYHLLSLRRVIEGNFENAPAAPAKGEAELLQSIRDGTTTPTELTRYCLEFIAEKYLLARRHRMTRLLGQFETKARILTYFLDGHHLAGEPKYLTVQEQHRLVTEIGVCWMHAGRLHLAKQSLTRASSIGRKQSTREIRAWIDSRAAAEMEIPRFWVQQVETAATSGLIDSRLGRVRDSVMDVIEEEQRQCERVVELLRESLDDEARALTATEMAMARASRRIICRRAYFDLLSGRVQDALTEFDRARRIEKRCGNDYLSGDAGRRHVQALLRSDHRSEENLDLATKIVEGNLAQWERAAAKRRLSNDIIAVQTSKCTLLRAKQRYAEAAAVLEEVEAHDFLKRGECPYFARAEVVLERCRLQIATGQDLDRTADELKPFILQLLDSHHSMLANEARLLLAEIVEEDRERLLREVDNIIANNGWRLRREDIRLLRNGGSPVRELIC